jgi:hypothetical protein
MRKRNLLPMNLQFFAEPDGETVSGAAGTGAEGQAGAGTQGTQGQVVAQTPPEFDYDKLAEIINGKQSVVAEETVLKNYFKQQGLSQEDVKLLIH